MAEGKLIMANALRTVGVVAVLLCAFARFGLDAQVRAQPSRASDLPPHIDIGRVVVHEGSDFFTLEVACHLRYRGPHAVKQPCHIRDLDAVDYIRIAPEVKFQVMAGSGRFRLIGPFAPRTAYSLTFLPGLRGRHRAVLAKPVAKAVRTPGFKPMFRFLGRARYLPRLQGAALAFEARNVEHLRLVYRQIFPQNLIFWLSKNQEAATSDVAETVHRQDLRLAAKADTKTTDSLDLVHNPQSCGTP